jgi:hypothetical protein
MKRKVAPITLTSLLLGLGFDWLFYGKIPGISVFLYTALVLGLTFYLSVRFKSHVNKSVYWIASVSLFFAAMVFVRANPFLAFVNICTLLYLLLMVARLSQKPAIGLSQFEIPQYITLISSTPFKIIRESFQFLTRALSSRSVTTAPKASYIPIIRGLIFSLPILFLFLILLSSADLVFKEFITSIFHPNVSPETVFRIGLIGFVTSVFMGAYAFIFIPTVTPEHNTRPAQKRLNLGATESYIILGSVSTLFLIFVIIQFAYLFGGLGQVSSTGYTYAEYARKGFFELIAVAAISWMLILTIKKCTAFRTAVQGLLFKWLSGILMAEVVVIMLSAHRRLNLYEDAYGFTTLRLLSHLFILWLGVAFVLLLIHIVREKSEKYFALPLFISALCFLALINFINPDNFIARENINRFDTTGKLDLLYLSNLSDDATPAIARLLDNPNEAARKSAANILYLQTGSSMDRGTHWQSANIARHHANQIFRDRAAQIETGKGYSEYPELD